MSDLSTVKGMTSRHIKILKENGVSTAEMLAMSSILAVEDMKGIGEKTAKKLIWNARDILEMTDFTPLSGMYENTEYFTTGSKELDRILGGGFQTGKITEVFGPFKSGKANLAHIIAVTALLPKSKGGLSGATAYIDAENTFSKDKIKRIVRRFHIDPKIALNKIFISDRFKSKIFK